MRKPFQYILLIFLLTVNCVTPFEFEPEEGGTYFVVSGGINQLDEINKIKLSFSTRYGSNSNARPVEDATVVLVNSQNQKEQFYHEGEGIYAHYSFQIPVEVGESYQIEIAYRNKIYRSDLEKVPQPVVPDSLSYNVGYAATVNVIGNEVTYENINIFINTPINTNGKNSYLRWKVDESWAFTERWCSPLYSPRTCYMYGKLEPERIFLYSSEEISGNYLEGKLIAQKRILDRVEFIEKHFFNAHQYTLTKEAYEYWEKVTNLANPSGDIFDIPPAPLPGNIYNVNNPEEIVLGYFEVAGKAITRVYLTQADIRPFTISSKQYLCSYWSNSGYETACCNCIILDNSSYDRPEYWH